MQVYFLTNKKFNVNIAKIYHEEPRKGIVRKTKTLRLPKTTPEVIKKLRVA
jgi:hypothetical protein